MQEPDALDSDASRTLQVYVPNERDGFRFTNELTMFRAFPEASPRKRTAKMFFQEVIGQDNGCRMDRFFFTLKCPINLNQATSVASLCRIDKQSDQPLNSSIGK